MTYFTIFGGKKYFETKISCDQAGVQALSPVSHCNMAYI